MVRKAKKKGGSEKDWRVVVRVGVPNGDPVEIVEAPSGLRLLRVYWNKSVTRAVVDRILSFASRRDAKLILEKYLPAPKKGAGKGNDNIPTI